MNTKQLTPLKLLLYSLFLPLAASILALMPTVAFAQDKSGVKPQVISLPSGPGSLEGLGENFEPNLSTGTSSYPVKFIAAPGRVGFQPELSLDYDGGNANGPWGMGWKLSIPAIQRRTEEGLPSYKDGQDTFIYSNGEKLVALKDGTYRFENESTFMRFRRITGGGWEGQTPDGMRYIFGETTNARVDNARGTFRWELERVIDLHGNDMSYVYLHDGGYAYPREIRYNDGASTGGENNGGGPVYNAVIFNYTARPDTYTDRRSGAPIRVGLRGTDIQMWAQGKLVRAYAFTYEPERSTGKYSLLIKVEQVGDDGTSKLPPQSFSYTQFDATTATVVPMQNPPPVALTNRDADLVDINADGLPDVVYTPEDGQHRFYLNRGQGRWQVEPVLPENSPGERISNPNVRMADMDGDGVVDLLVKASSAGAPLYYYSNKTGSEWQQTDRVDFGPAPAFDLNDPNVQLMDVNNDHRIDVVLTTSGRLKIWLARNGAWSQQADFDVPAPAAGDAANFADPKFKIGDMTGDRMDDVVMVRDGQVVLWEHNGNGSYEEPRPILNPPSGIGAQDVMIQMGDLNNDGQMDLVLPGNRTVTYWLSLGDGSLTDPITILDTPAFNAQDTAVRLADIDGDGATELLFSSSQGMAYVDFSTQEQPFLLRTVDNGLGRTIKISYKPSINDYIADWDAGNPWQVNLPFPVQVVNRVAVHDANSGDDYTIDYHYRDGYYDGVQKEFRGFARSQEIQVGDETAATTVTNLVYDVGKSDESHKGMLLESEVLAQNGHCSGDYVGCFQRTVNQLQTRVVINADATSTGKPIAYAFVKQTDSFVHEQQSEPVQLRQTFAQDDYGNQTQLFNYGKVCGEDVTCGNDEVLKYTEYIYDETHYLFNRPMRTYQTDAAGNFVSEVKMYYDGDPFVGLPSGQLTSGDLTREETSLGPQANNRTIATKRQQFDQFGNVVGMKDGNGNLTSVAFDPLQHTFPVLEQLHFSNGKLLTFAASYHPGFGKMMAATDYNGYPHLFAYDTFGRITKIVRPGDSLAKPTQQFRYEIGSPRSAIYTEQRERSGEDGVVTSVVYFDGLGRKLQTRSEATQGQVVVTEASLFNARQSVRDQFQPYFDTGFAYKTPDVTLPHSTLYYDPMDRVVRTVNTDGSFTSVVHKPLMQQEYDEEDNRTQGSHANTPKTLRYDGLQRLISVDEMNIVNGQAEHYLTQYEYDRLGNLTKIIDAENHVKTMSYDALSRKLRMVDPDKGEMIYTYDDNGNTLTTHDAKGQTIRYSYDAANRVLNEQWSYDDGRPTVTNAIYHYDNDITPAAGLPGMALQNTQGQLAFVEDQAGLIFHSYDGRGNITGSMRYFKSEGLSLLVKSQYDAMDRLTQVTYPNGMAVRYSYDTRGLMQGISGFVDAVNYTASGQRESVHYSNGAETDYTYDNRLRLAHLKTTKAENRLQDLAYAFDGVNNLVNIVDGRPTSVRAPANDQSQSFQYDSLYRLTQATGTYGQINYGYDAIGNMVRQSSTTGDARLNPGEISYGGQQAGPHALTSFGGKPYSYDANGNLVSKGGSKGGSNYTWNARDQLIAANGAGTQSQYLYDSQGGRVKQTVIQSGTTTTTLYLGRYVEVRGNKLVLYVFDQDQRVAEVTTAFAPPSLLTDVESQPAEAAETMAGQKRWTIADHLGSANLLLDEQGKVVSEMAYYPFGLTRYENNGKEVIHGFTGKELDASGLHYYGARYYDASIGHFISADPLYVENPTKNSANPQSLNVYAYGLNSPLVYNDPTGFDPKATTKYDMQNKTYAVSAANLKKFADTMSKRSWAGLTNTSTSVTWKVDAQGRVKEANVNIKITVTLPKWNVPNNLGPKAKAEYERFSKGLEKHEQGHVDISRQHYDGLADDLIGKTAAEARKLVGETNKAHKKAQEDYDDANHHGVDAPGDDSTRMNIPDDDAPDPGSKKK
ncbi:MAG: toxin TcdB middle/N-terminal domain-containing protein [Caldilineaceae bacterium]